MFLTVGNADGDGLEDIVAGVEYAHGDRRGVYWLRQGATTADRDWVAFDISGPSGIKYDLVRLLDLSGNGTLDVLTNEESEGGGGLGVVWYENPHAKAK